jgi:hypothetical protein
MLDSFDDITPMARVVLSCREPLPRSDHDLSIEEKQT